MDQRTAHGSKDSQVPEQGENILNISKNSFGGAGSEIGSGPADRPVRPVEWMNGRETMEEIIWE